LDEKTVSRINRFYRQIDIDIKYLFVFLELFYQDSYVN